MDKDYQKRLQEAAQTAIAGSFMCGCIGPQNGEPLCPCMMRSVKIIDGRYVRVQDLGPAPQKQTPPDPG